MSPSPRPLPILLAACLPLLLNACSRERTAAPARPVSHWLSTSDKTRQFTRLPDTLIFGDGEPVGPVITVDSSRRFQTMEGFGAALTGSSAFLLNRLPADTRADLLRELFDPESNGIGLSYLRLCIGASDFSAYGNYSYDDLPPGRTDPELATFSLDPDRRDVIPVLREIVALHPDIRIMATPWSPPAWMTTNASMVGGKLKPEWYEAYARYFVRYVEDMRREGIRIDAITPQNEPLHASADYPCLDMSAAEQGEFIKKHLGPALRAAGLATKIIVYDHNCDRPDYPLAILDDPEANPFVDGSAFHLYGGDIGALSAVHEAHPDKHLYFTEQSGGDWAPDYGGNLRWYARHLLIGAPRNWSRNVLFWNLALDENHGPTNKGCADCRGVITIDSKTSALTRNEEYVVLAHAAKFVRPGSARVASEGGDSGLIHVAFRNPEGQLVLLVLNDHEEARDFSIQFAGKFLRTRLPGGGLGTWVW